MRFVIAVYGLGPRLPGASARHIYDHIRHRNRKTNWHRSERVSRRAKRPPNTYFAVPKHGDGRVQCGPRLMAGQMVQSSGFIFACASLLLGDVKAAPDATEFRCEATLPGPNRKGYGSAVLLVVDKSRQAKAPNRWLLDASVALRSSKREFPGGCDRPSLR